MNNCKNESDPILEAIRFRESKLPNPRIVGILEEFKTAFDKNVEDALLDPNLNLLACFWMSRPRTDGKIAMNNLNIHEVYLDLSIYEISKYVTSFCAKYGFYCKKEELYRSTVYRVLYEKEE